MNNLALPVGQMIQDFFYFNDVDDVEERYALVFFSGLMFTVLVLLVTSLGVDDPLNGDVPSPFLLGIATISFVFLSLATVSTTVLPKMLTDKSSSRFSEQAYLAFIFFFNVIVILLIVVSFVAQLTDNMYAYYDQIGGVESTRIIIIASIFIELIVDTFAFLMLRRRYNTVLEHIKDHWVMSSIICTEFFLAFVVLLAPQGYLFSPDLVLGFILTVGHLLTHAFNP